MCFESRKNVIENQSVTNLIICQRIINSLNRQRTAICLFGKLKRGLPDLNTMVERSFCGLVPRVDPKTYGSALHKNNWMMAVFAGDRRRQPKNIPRLSPPGDQFKADGRQVVAFINNELPVIANNVVNFSFSYQTLDEGHIDYSGRTPFSAADSAYLASR